MSAATLSIAMSGAWGDGPAGRLLAQAGDPDNPIARENRLTGDADWDLESEVPSGDPTIQGFSTDISVNVGDTVHFKIRTDAAAYTIAIYRLGYYDGLGARKIGQVTPSATLPQSQLPCLSDAVTGLYDCGTWQESASWSVPTTAVSGVYLAKLRRSDNGGASHIVFIVRDDARRADLLFQTSDTTWQAYNQWPGIPFGGSLYCGLPVSNGGTEYGCAARATKVSYNRPFDTRDHDARSFVFGAELPMLMWLERNGYDVKYWSGIDTDRRGGELSDDDAAHVARRPKAFLSIGHDEYWSGPQRSNVEGARDAGINLAFFSGNEMYWKTRWEPSIDGSGTDHRTLVTYKETMANGVGAKIDPQPAWTGTWRDPRFSPPSDGGRPENAVSGQLWTVNCCATSMEVPEADGKMRLWRGTDIAALAPGAVATLAGGGEVLGYEWDEDVDNAVRPPGIVRMSTTTRVAPEHIEDFGIGFGPAPAVHHLTLYRTANGALVFAAGTIHWSWGLDLTHDDGGVGVDARMQQATVNVLADMGVGAGSLQQGLIAAAASTDATPPTSRVTAPAAGASLPSGTPVTVVGTAVDGGGGRVGGVEVSVDNGLTWHPAAGRETWSYTFTPSPIGPTVIWSRAVDDSGNLEAGTANVDASGQPQPPTKSTSTSASVTIGQPTCPCTLWPDQPTPAVPLQSDFSAVELGTRFTTDVSGYVTGLRFYQGAGNSGPHIGHIWTASGTLLAEATFTDDPTSGWKEITLPWPVAVQAGASYVASYHTTGGYAVTNGYFSMSAHDSGILHAPQDRSAGHNGTYRYDNDDPPLPQHFPSDSFEATNYWVDVVFNTTSAGDVTPPVITGLVLSTSGVPQFSWTTGEPSTSRVLFGPANADGTAPDTLIGNVGSDALVSAHQVSLATLIAGTTYYYRVESIDAAGNAASSALDSFTMPAPGFHDTTVADFAAGTAGPGVIVSSATGDGALAMPVLHGFSGSALPVGWSYCLWSASCTPVGQGSAVVAGGVLTVDGARVDTNLYGLPPAGGMRTLDFDAVFSGDPFEHIGFGLTFAGAPWAFFSTAGGGALWARTASDSVSQDTVIPPPAGTSWFTDPHHFRIEWSQTTATYYVDGQQVAAHSVAITTALQPIAASDFTAGSGAIVVRSIDVGPLVGSYSAAGTFESRVFDAGASVPWGAATWTSTVPPNTSLALSVRTGDTLPLTAAYTPIAQGGIVNGVARYIQYRADLASQDPGAAPVLNDVTIPIASANHPPVANADAYTVQVNSTLSVAAPGALANDTDLDGDALTAIEVAPPQHGSVAFNANGSFQYIPLANFVGADSFQYKANDGRSDSAPATIAITVNKRPQTIAFAALGPRTYGDAPFAVNAIATSGLPVSFSVVSGPATLSGNTVTITGAGTVTIRASQAGDAITSAAPDVDRTLTVYRATPAFSSLTSPSIVYSTPTATAAGRISSGSLIPTGSVTITLNGVAVAAPIQPDGTFSAALPSAGLGVAGSPYAVIYVYPGDSNFGPVSPNGATTLTIAPAAQTIAFGALADKAYGDAPFALTATASSALPVSFAIVSGPAVVSGNTLTITGAGVVAVRASQPGNANYAAAPSVDRSFTVAKGSQTITFGALPNRTYGDAPFALTATASSALPVGFAVVSGPATIAGNVVTITGVGAVTVRASQAGNANFNPAPTVDQTFTVNKAAPIITWSDPDAVPLNTALSYVQLNATANTAGTFVYSPALSTVLNTAGARTLSVTFTPTDTTTYSTATKSVQITVVAPGAQTMTSSLTVSTPSVQYSDIATFSVSVTSTLAGVAPAGKVAFKIGTQSMGVAALTPVGNPATAQTFQATWSGQLLEPSPYGTQPTGQLKPSLKVVSAQLLAPDSRFTMTNPTSKSMTIAVEDARVAYTGATTLTSSGGAVTLTAAVTEPADGSPGELRTATVQFVNRANNAVLGTVPVAADGTASFTWTTAPGTYSIGFVVGNYYSRNNAADNVSVTVR